MKAVACMPDHRSGDGLLIHLHKCKPGAEGASAPATQNGTQRLCNPRRLTGCFISRPEALASAHSVHPIHVTAAPRMHPAFQMTLCPRHERAMHTPYCNGRPDSILKTSSIPLSRDCDGPRLDVAEFSVCPLVQLVAASLCAAPDQRQLHRWSLPHHLRKATCC